MSEIIIKRKGLISLGSVDSEDDLKPRPGINLNAPPADGRCDCCGRHISELKPYGGPGDPLVGVIYLNIERNREGVFTDYFNRCYRGKQIYEVGN
jgi:hypothetical protein